MGKLSSETKEFFKSCSELADHSMCMQMATGYRSKFNYTYFYYQLQTAVKDLGSDEDVKELYPGGIHK